MRSAASTCSFGSCEITGCGSQGLQLPRLPNVGKIGATLGILQGFPSTGACYKSICACYILPHIQGQLSEACLACSRARLSTLLHTAEAASIHAPGHQPQLAEALCAKPNQPRSCMKHGAAVLFSIMFDLCIRDYSCWSDEDLVGRIARLGRTVHPSTHGLRTIEKSLGLYREALDKLR